MRFFDIKPQPENNLDLFNKWMNETTADFTQMVGKKIPVKQAPEIGEMRVQWHQGAFAEEIGEFVTVEMWNGEGWEQHGLDVHQTVEDLFNLSWKINNFCTICGAEEMTARCNNADCV